ncbi:HAD-IIB family hydrolase, partial [Bacillus proteolyticus]
MELESEVKAIVLDLDGTLLDSQKKVSERNRKAILACLKKGIKVIFATARAPRSVKVFLPHELQDIAIMIYYNGALVVDNALGYRQHYPIESTITNEIIEFVITHQADACLSVESEDTWYSNKTLDYNKTMNAVVNPIVVPLNE